MRRLLTFIALLACFGIVAPSTGAGAAACSQQVLTDWSDNGRIDRLYPLRCYDEAIAALPPDIRDYTNAEAVIERALTSAVRTRPASARTATAASDSSSPPTVVLVVAGASLALLVAGALGHFRRRGSAGTRRIDG
jgi:hypothetical protein